MKQKETTINIEVNIFGTRFTVMVPFSEQDAVRATETQMKAYLKKLREKHSKKTIAECMAMMAYDYAKGYFAMKAQETAYTAEAEDLLKATARLLGEEIPDDFTEDGTLDFGEY